MSSNCVRDPTQDCIGYLTLPTDKSGEFSVR